MLLDCSRLLTVWIFLGWKKQILPRLHMKVAAGCHDRGEATPILLPINILEDFTKPCGTQTGIRSEQMTANWHAYVGLTVRVRLSLSFRLFGNVVADELTVGVMISAAMHHFCYIIRLLGYSCAKCSCHGSILLYS